MRRLPNPGPWVRTAGVTLCAAFALLVPPAWGAGAPAFILEWGTTGVGSGQFAGPSAIATDAVGNVYVADSANHRIQKFDSLGTFLTSWGIQGSAPGEFERPSGIAVDAGGAVYVTDTGNHRVQKFDGNGVFLVSWGSSGHGPGRFRSPDGVAVGPNGNIYVVDSGNDRIQKFDDAGAFLTRWGSPGSADGRFDAPQGIDVDINGLVYVADAGNDRMQQFDADGVFLSAWGSLGSADGQFNAPSDVALDVRGRIYVVDTDNNRVQRFRDPTSFDVAWGSSGSGPAQFGFPSGIAARGRHVYVADFANDRIQMFTTAEPVLVFVRDVGNDQGLQVRIQVRRSENDRTASPIPILGYRVFRRVDPLTPKAAPTVAVLPATVALSSGTWDLVEQLPAHGEAEYNAVVPTLADSTDAGIHWSVFFVRAITSDSLCFFDSAADSGYSIDNLVPNAPPPIEPGAQVANTFDPPRFVLTWGAFGTGPGQFDFPAGISIDDDGTIYVSDLRNDRVQKFDYNGDFLGSWGTAGTGPGQFDHPRGNALHDGSIYVVDQLNRRVQKLDLNGNFLLEWGSLGSGPGEFNEPLGIAVDTNGNVYVTDGASIHRVQKFDADGNFLTMWGTFGGGDGQFSHPQGVAIDVDGNVYVADTHNHRIQKFDANGNLLLKWGSGGSGDGQFSRPFGVTVSDSGWVFVCDWDNARVQVFDTNGSFLTKWGSYGSEDGEFIRPAFVGVGTAGNVFVTDRLRHDVQRFQFVPTPEIAFVTDVTGDQGRHVTLRFQRSDFEGPGSVFPVVQYEQFRRIDPLPEKAGQRPVAGDTPSRLEARIAKARASGMVSDPTILTVGWDFVEHITSQGLSEYDVTLPTLADSTAEHGIHWSVYFVRVATDDPMLFFDSLPDSGYSVDNLQPASPENFQAAAMGADVQLGWDASGELDLRYYTLYRGTDPNFSPDDTNRLVTLTETTYLDVGAAHSLVYYKLSSIDFAGNESAFASAGLTASDTDDASAPQVFAVRLGASNPFRKRTAITYDLPVAARVTLVVYDARGRLVRQVLGPTSLPSGSHRTEWDGTDERGVRVAPGVYWFRFEGREATRVVKAVLLK